METLRTDESQRRPQLEALSAATTTATTTTTTTTTSSSSSSGAPLRDNTDDLHRFPAGQSGQAETWTRANQNDSPPLSATRSPGAGAREGRPPKQLLYHPTSPPKTGRTHSVPTNTSTSTTGSGLTTSGGGSSPSSTSSSVSGHRRHRRMEVWTSNRRRASHTCTYFVHRGYKVVEKSQLCELNPGVVDGLTDVEIRQRYPTE